MIFTWNGKEFQFITDVLGVAPLGASSGDGNYFPVDHDEYVQIPGERAGAARRPLRDPHHRGTARGRRISIRSSLIALDHPSGIDDLHQRQVQGAAVSRVPAVRRRGPDPSGRGARQRRPRRAASARGTRSGVSRRLQRDLSGRRRDCTTSTSISARRRADNRAVLVLNGWVDWADGSTFLRRVAGGPERA